MTRTPLDEVSCSIARTVNVLSDAWSWLIVRDTYLGVNRFDDYVADLGITRRVLSRRLSELVEAQILKKQLYASGPDRFDYLLTEKGAELVPLLAVLAQWGDRWEPSPGGPPIIFEHGECGPIQAVVACSCCAEALSAENVAATAGPGGTAGPGTALIGRLLAAQRSQKEVFPPEHGS
ncbi:DNA-binding HxlR family transcriptional regulator [Psychromicrobium silvestre]|uniref:DNA-binding HxlR family transcriptional regulator n=1 Tax=Psychromicrobium silvestre TaxID=1645614 RepID=A0A7Y9S4L1_9MICC|nr:helix-turn-helix domain-containing protein [Psychromicrobium silvestre]NYE94444.1 DNA-binding HxlR family transcriptional regulator [Psychromicrobium silvestre]